VLLGKVDAQPAADDADAREEHNNTQESPLEKEGQFFRSDVHMNGRQSSVSGIFELKIDNPSSKDLTGTATTTAGGKETKLDAASHATLK
jgi:hypothetical protein